MGEGMGEGEEEEVERNGRKDKQTNGRKISPLYRTSSPIGAAAQKGSCYRANKTESKENPMIDLTRG